jgi:hypothetical protein
MLVVAGHRVASGLLPQPSGVRCGAGLTRGFMPVLAIGSVALIVVGFRRVLDP